MIGSGCELLTLSLLLGVTTLIDKGGRLFRLVGLACLLSLILSLLSELTAAVVFFVGVSNALLYRLVSLDPVRCLYLSKIWGEETLRRPLVVLAFAWPLEVEVCNPGVATANFSGFT